MEVSLRTTVASEIATEFARAEGFAFVRGTGVNQPEGFLTAATATAEDSVRARRSSGARSSHAGSEGPASTRGPVVATGVVVHAPR